MLDEDALMELGFASENEFIRMVNAMDISTPDKMRAFQQWKQQDGSKAGLEALGPRGNSVGPSA